MKIIRLALVIAFGIFLAPAFGQKATKKTTKEICQCMDKIDPNAPIEELKRQSEQCITSGIMNNFSGLVKEYKIKDDDSDGAEKMGEAIGLKLVKECESARNIFIRMNNEGKEENTEGEGK